MLRDGGNRHGGIALAQDVLVLTQAQDEGDAAAKRDGIAKLMTPAQIAEAQKLARQWKPTKQPPRLSVVR